MKTIVKTGLLFVLAFFPMVAVAANSGIPPEPTWNKGDAKAFGLQLAKYADNFDAGWVDQYSKSKMTLFDARGDSVQRAVTQMILEGDDGDKSMVRFMSPAEIRGVAALIHEHPKTTDDSWLYLPASRRVRRVSGANRTASFQGTEFTYEDLSSLIVDRYDWKFLGEGEVTSDGEKQKIYRLEATPNYKDTGYAKLIISLNPKHWRAEKIEYFDLAGERLKTLVNANWKRLHGRYWRATKLDMSNNQTRKRTVLEINALFLNLSKYKKKDGSARANLTADNFTRRVLEKS